MSWIRARGHRGRWVSWLLPVGAAVGLYCGSQARGSPAGVVGDRLVVSVNQANFTQRQAEIYLAVKEAIRGGAGDRVAFIGASNWPQALDAFTEDMAVLLELQRLGSFTVLDQASEKYAALLRQRLREQPQLKAQLRRLGADEPAIARGLDTVLRVSAFRQSKDRQESQSSQAMGQKGQGRPSGAPKWLTDLLDRTVTRRYVGASQYQLIEPVVTGASGGR